MQTAKIHSVETLGALDGPGIRYVLFLHGCPFRCKFCHNPDTWKSGGFKTVSSSEIFEDVAKYADFFKFSKGGFTASGGEPLMQKKFLIELFGRLKSIGVETAVDTCGYTYIDEDTEELASLTDLFMLDIKHLDPDTHLGLTGKPNDKVFNFLNFISAKGKRIWIRIVLLEGLSATPEYIKKISAFLKNYKIEKIELLPYHNMGEKKWEELGLKYELKDAKTPDRGKVAALAKILEDDGYAVSFQ